MGNLFPRPLPIPTAATRATRDTRPNLSLPPKVVLLDPAEILGLRTKGGKDKPTERLRARKLERQVEPALEPYGAEGLAAHVLAAARRAAIMGRMNLQRIAQGEDFLEETAVQCSRLVEDRRLLIQG